ncbi:MAG: T9SS type A sorting domain-containing protein [Bacteroidia bacterium]|jgi:hypothetical protein|nr:T9SS type A sorting domain-containing protein [Bacteroidia bacterium]
MKRIFYTLVLVTVLFGVKGQVLLEDNFTGTAGTAATANGWTQIGTTATNPINLTTGGLSFTGYPGSGIGNAVGLTTSGQDIYKDATSTITSGSAFAGFIANISATQATGDYFFAVLPNTSTSTFSCRVFARSSVTPGFFNVAINKSNEAATYSTTDFAIGVTHLFYVEYVFRGGSNDDSVYLYVIPNGSSVPTTKPSTPTAAGFNSAQPDLTNIGRLALRQGSAANAATVQVDGIRMGALWDNGALPVQWRSFTASQTPTGNQLRWSTATEVNNNQFEVQRSNNGRTFETIGVVKGKGNSQKVTNYTFTDEVVTKGTVFYRLKQIDFDGKFEYSKTVSITVATPTSGISQLSPNPFSNEMNVTIKAASSGTASVVVMDMVGKVHHSFTSEVSSGAQTIRFETADMPDGIYFVRATINGETFTQKIIKK